MALISVPRLGGNGRLTDAREERLVQLSIWLVCYEECVAILGENVGLAV